MASKWSDQFLGSTPKSFSLDEIRKSKFGEYFEHLQQNVDKYSGENSLFRSANEILSLEIEKSNLELFINNLLSHIPDFGFEFRRLILTTTTDKTAGQFIAGTAANEFQYEYLEAQILSVLETNARVFISDTSRIRTLKFLPEKDIPKSVLGFPLELVPGWKGYLWFANSKEVSLTKDQVDGLEIIKVTADTSIVRAIRNMISTKENHLWNSAFMQFPYPFLIFINKKIAIINQEAEKISKLDNQEAYEKFGDMILSAINQGKTHVNIDDRSYHLNSSINFESNKSENIFVFLVNESEVSTQRNYLDNVIKAVSLNLETPLKNIMGYTGMIPLLADIEEPQQEYLNRITREADRCLTFSNDLLDLSRLSGDNPFVTREVSIGELTSNLFEASQHLLRQKRISVEDNIENPEQTIKIDVVLISQAFYLILEYMLDHLESGKRILIATCVESNVFKIHFSDNGKGISEIDLAFLNQTESESSIDPRIRTSRGIMQLCGGGLVIKSELGKGSEYTFFWPFS